MSSHLGSTALKTAQQTDTGTMKFGGLCTTCEHLESCCFKRSPEHPILFCEEFNVSSSPMNFSSTQEPVLVSKARKVSLYTGLCINCDRRDTCVYLQAGAGGWHCEEYE